VDSKTLIIVIAVFLVTSLSVNVIQYAGNDAQRNRIADISNQLEASRWHVSDLETAKARLQSQIANLTTQVTNLQNHTANISSQCSNITSEIVNLQTENDNLKRENTELQNQLYEKGPRLITKLGTTDVKIDHTAHHSNQTRLFIEGVVWNIGVQVANDCRLHIILYQGNNVANDTYIELGTINALDCANVRTDIYYYTGERLTNWKITPEYS
jgi:regulator of replication initiation timing